MSKYKVVVSDQVFPSVEVERELLGEIDAELTVATGDVESVLPRRRCRRHPQYLPALDSRSIARLDKCRIIARYGIGFDNIDLNAAADAGIVVTNVPDYSVEEVATHALALILASLRKVVIADESVRSGPWSIDNFRPIRRLSTLTVGLVGYGRIARRIAAPLEALGAEVIAHDPYLQPGPDLPPLLELDTVLARADIVSLHLPLTEETRGIIGTDAMARMSPTAILINTSRGPLVDLDALTTALREGTSGGRARCLRCRAARCRSGRRRAQPHRHPAHGLLLRGGAGRVAEEGRYQVIKVLTGEKPDYQVN